MKLLVCDLDGVIADNTARFQKAAEAKQEYIETHEIYDLSISRQHEATSLYWQTAFTPELVSLDTLIPGVLDALDDLATLHDYRIIYLTSRPESMREATIHWLSRNGIQVGLGDNGKQVIGFDLLITKPPAFQYTKTTVWKAGMIQTLASLYNATDVLIVDDEQANRDEYLKYLSDGQHMYRSLQEAVEA